MYDSADMHIALAKEMGLHRIAFIMEYMVKTVTYETDDPPNLILYVQYYRILVIELQCTKDEYDLMILEYED